METIFFVFGRLCVLGFYRYMILFLCFFVGYTGYCMIPPPGFIEVRITVCDNLSKRPIKHVSITAYNEADSTFHARPFGKMNDQNVMMLKKGMDYYMVVGGASLGDAGNDETKLAEIMLQGEYETERVDLPLNDLKDDQGIYELVVNLSRKKTVNLSEITVTASKVKFYNRGDTLVYDASAFVLAEGSTLDALLDQMPGVELKNNGQIYVNGKFVEELLLNGKNLFNGNNELMLENLPAYTVKNIEVYKKHSDRSELLGADIGDSRNVMDVKLKRQYMIGWLGNIDAGYGTEDRYLAKLFALWFSDNVSVSLYGSSNNLSDVNAPGKSDGSWSSDKMGSSVLTRHYGGLSYTAEGFESKWKMNGSVDVDSRRSDSRTEMNSRQYLAGGDLFGYRWQDNESKSTEIKTSHYYRRKAGNKAAFEISPEFSYRHNDEHGDMTSAMFGVEQAQISADVIKNIYDGNPATARNMVNRNISERMQRGHQLGTRISASYDHVVRSGGKRGLIVIDGDFGYDKVHDNRFERYRLDYPAADRSELRSKYFRNHPNYDRGYTGGIRYIMNVDPNVGNRSVFSFAYKYNRKEKLTTSLLYNLDQLTDFDAEGSSIGHLPSQNEYAATIDPDQSHRVNSADNQHRVSVNWSSYMWYGKSVTMVQSSYTLNMDLLNRRLTYMTLENSQSVDRTRFLPSLTGFTNIGLDFNRDKENKNTYKYWKAGLLKLNVGLVPQKVSLLDAITRVDTSDPMNLQSGNKRIKDSYDVNITADFDQDKTGRRRVYHIGYENLINAVGNGVWYNPITGVATWRPFNVNGNWIADVSYFYFFSFGKGGCLDMSTKTVGSYRQSVDMSGRTTDEDEALTLMPQKRRINTSSLSENIKLNWRIGKNRLTALAEMSIYDYNGRDSGFTDFTSAVYKYGVSGVAKLPIGFELSTDFTFYTRRGFVDSRLNTTDVIWNARLTKSIMKGAMIFAVDGYDLFRQLTNLTYTINAQARTEVVSNVVPSYVLFHVMYKFNHQPAMGGRR